MQPANAYLKDTVEEEVEDYTIVTTVLEEMNSTEGPEEGIPGIEIGDRELCYLQYYVEAKGLEAQGKLS